MCQLHTTAAEFVKPLNNTSAAEYDETIVLECELSNELVPCQWYKDDILITVGPKVEVIDDGKKRKLVLHDVRPEDTGNFRCVVGDKESSATLDVKGNLKIPIFMSEE